ncbi:ATP-binding cassette domain-containing protein [Dactylosporangium sp. NPDC050688]|uniref:ABC transporter ATP-binding protein n=1 Tax=Dactylosporangium sp. NPDC050688 TaxID=3157217 RepID=UPI00341132DB
MQHSSKPLIVAKQLTKVFRRPDRRPGLTGAARHLFERRYAERVAVDRLDLVVEEGEALAYVGPNGAGKSTTIKMMTGILVPTSGEIRVNGIVPHRDRVENARRIGVVFGQRTQLWWDIPVRDSLELLRDMHGVEQCRYDRTLERLDAVLELAPLLPVTARRLSLGQRMRADLAAALLHEPPLVYLDEPTIGLDIEVKDRIRAFVKEIVAEGTTVVLTTHDLGDIEDICRRIVIVDDGRMAFDGALAQVKDAYARDRCMRLELAAPPASLEALSASLPAASVAPGDHDREVTVTFDRFQLSATQVLSTVMRYGELLDVHIDEPAIEHVVRLVYAGQLSAGQSHDGPVEAAA